jgi:glycosyltransferase involved in cell wall biosynthesis
MPMAVLEAMAWGLPCVVTEETNMGDILRSANAGLICSCSIEAIATSLLEVCRMEKPRLQQMGENGKQWVIDNLTWSKVADRYLEMYNDYAGD